MNGRPEFGSLNRPQLEQLEPRLLLSVTLDNGLPSDAPDYFAIYMDGGGGSRQSLYAGTDTIFDYFAYLEIDGQVFNLYEEGSSPVLQGDKVVSDASLSVTDGRETISIRRSH